MIDFIMHFNNHMLYRNQLSARRFFGIYMGLKTRQPTTLLHINENDMLLFKGSVSGLTEKIHG